MFRQQTQQADRFKHLAVMALFILLTALPAFNGLYAYSLNKAGFLISSAQEPNMMLSTTYLKATIAEFIGHRFLVLYGLLALIGLPWLIGKRRFRPAEVYLSICILFAVLLGWKILKNFGNPQDMVALFTLIPPLLIASTYRLFAEADRRWGIALLTAAVLVVGTLEKAEALRTFDLNNRSEVQQQNLHNSRRIVSPYRDWMWQTSLALRHMGVDDYALVEYRMVRLDAEGKETILAQTDSLSIPLAYTAGLFRLQLDPVPAGRSPHAVVEAILLPDDKLSAAAISALNKHREQALAANARSVRWAYFHHATQTFSVPAEQFFIVLSAYDPPPES